MVKDSNNNASDIQSKFFKIELYLSYNSVGKDLSIGALWQCGEIAYANPNQNEDLYNWDTLSVPISEINAQQLENHVAKSVKKYLKKNRIAVWPKNMKLK